jgi:hypothetical protein
VAAMARGSAATSGTARLSRPARAATSIPWNSTSAAKAATNTHPGPTRSKSGLPQRSRLVADELVGREVPGADARVYAPADSRCWG